MILYFWEGLWGGVGIFVCLFIGEKQKPEFSRRTSSAPGRFLNQAQTSGVEQSNSSTKLDFWSLEEEKQQWKVTSRYRHHTSGGKKFSDARWKLMRIQWGSSSFSYHSPSSWGGLTVGPARLLLHKACSELVNAATRIISNTYSGTWSSPAVLLLLPFLIFERLLLR